MKQVSPGLQNITVEIVLIQSVVLTIKTEMQNVALVIGFISLVLFLVPVTLIMHAPWKVEDPQTKMGETVNFMKNFALVGAVLILLAYTLA